MQVSGAVDLQLVIVRNICMSHVFDFFVFTVVPTVW